MHVSKYLCMCKQTFCEILWKLDKGFIMMKLFAESKKTSSCGHFEMALSHYSRFEVFLFKNCMHVKTVQVGWFAIKTIISIHIFSFNFFLKKCENLQKISLILLTESQFFWTFFDLYPPCS